jgi:hypothetical protein
MEQKNSLEADLLVAVQELENFRDSLQISESARALANQELAVASQKAAQELHLAEQERQQLEIALRDVQETLVAKERRLQETDELYIVLDLKYRKLHGEYMRLRYSAPLASSEEQKVVSLSSILTPPAPALSSTFIDTSHTSQSDGPSSSFDPT